MFKWGVIGLLFAGAAFIYINYEDLQSQPELLRNIRIYHSQPDVEKHLTKFQDLIGKDYKGYRGHIYRVLTYSMHFLGGDDKYLPLVASALVFHDIGLWTDGTLAYLEPSCDQAEKNLGDSLSDEENRLVRNIIYWHHKITPFSGEHEDIVNAVIKADLIDASGGVISKGMPRHHITNVNKAIANEGFHQTLAEFGPRLHGWDVVRIVTDLSSIMKY